MFVVTRSRNMTPPTEVLPQEDLIKQGFFDAPHILNTVPIMLNALMRSIVTEINLGGV